MIFKKKRANLPMPPINEAPETTDIKNGIKSLEINSESEDELPKLRERQEKMDFSKENPNFLESLPEESFEEKKSKKERKEKEIFVKIENFRQILESITNIEKKIQDLDFLISKLQKLNNQETDEIENWRTNLVDVKNEVKNMNENLSEF